MAALSLEVANLQPMISGDVDFEFEFVPQTLSKELSPNLGDERGQAAAA
jgi:hypothetical protein